MTTVVKIINESKPTDSNSHTINVYANGNTVHGYTVPPGESVTVHVWSGSPITITEVEVVKGQ